MSCRQILCNDLGSVEKYEASFHAFFRKRQQIYKSSKNIDVLQTKT